MYCKSPSKSKVKSDKMAPSINGTSMKNLVKMEVQQALENELDNFHNLLIGAMARITCLESEICDLKMYSSSSQPAMSSTPSSLKSASSLDKQKSTPSGFPPVCRHWPKADALITKVADLGMTVNLAQTLSSPCTAAAPAKRGSTTSTRSPPSRVTPTGR